ncbi:uncharacterized protein LOC113874458 [Abrus precatorius]|uniref:Uncharacterized protein LOC113874458 n=1 Tax=Abrus precatorius TaxID=3816 RepID=A0A8B8MLJ9_ABRPR|nr:uncharacterized protein LOC113874458 [Abrus precatorius]
MSHLHHNSLHSDSTNSMELENGVTHSDLALVPLVSGLNLLMPTPESWFQSDTSTGYLEDAIAGRVIQCKEQKSPSCSKDQKVDQFPTCSTIAQLHDYCLTHQEKVIATNLSSSPPQSDTHEAAIKHDPARRSYASSELDENVFEGQQRKRIAYPFELVKGGGVEAETTLKDINNQILMTPSASKPIPHLVEDPMTHPCKFAKGFGWSGKAVASFTRIHTRGRGSIIIIRTKD